MMATETEIQELLHTASKDYRGDAVNEYLKQLIEVYKTMETLFHADLDQAKEGTPEYAGMALAAGIYHQVHTEVERAQSQLEKFLKNRE